MGLLLLLLLLLMELAVLCWLLLAPHGLPSLESTYMKTDNGQGQSLRYLQLG
jgi:hypothetical protein